MIALLSACGGGGGSNVDSSYSKTIIQNGVTYECKSENAAALCDNGNCTSCESSLDKIITASCSRITAACDNGLLKLKVGSNFSLNQVINTGTTMNSLVSILSAQKCSAVGFNQMNIGSWSDS